jgi:phosphohistidine swiveling domain-containing protein
LTSSVTGVLPVANGGTNSSTTLNNNRVMQSSGGAIIEAAAITAARALISDSNGIPTHSAVTATELGYVSGVTSAIQTQLDAKVDESREGAANGIATLDSGGKIPVSQLPSSVMEFKGAWNASTNSPTLADGTGDNGDTYRVSVAGSQNLGSGSISFEVGDFVIYNGTVWQRSPAQDLSGYATTDLDNLTVASLAAESLLVGSSSSAVEALAVGTNGQVLTVVAGAVAWAAPSSSSFEADWATADGTTKAITHNLGTKDVQVQVYDKADDSSIWVDSIVRTSTNVVTLTSSEAPNASSWRVLIIAQ